MATLKEFTFVGVSEHKGKTKVRYANNKNRVKKLEREGHTNIHFVELEEPSLKEDCIDRLLDESLPSEAAQEAVRKEARELGFIV